MPPESEGGVFIPTEKIYEQLVELNGSVRELITVTKAMQNELADKETRLRTVEKIKWGLPIAYLGVLISFISQFTKFSGKP